LLRISEAFHLKTVLLFVLCPDHAAIHSPVS